MDEPTFTPIMDGQMTIKSYKAISICPTVEPTTVPFEGFENKQECMEALAIVYGLKSVDGASISLKGLHAVLDAKCEESLLLEVSINGKNICKIHLVP